MATDSPTPEVKKPTPAATTGDASTPKHDAAPAAGGDQVKHDVAAGKIADPAKLHADATLTPGQTTSWKPATPATTGGTNDISLTQPIVLDNIYASTTTPFSQPAALDLTSTASLLGTKSTALDLSLAPAQPGANSSLLDKACTINDYNSAFGLGAPDLNLTGKNTLDLSTKAPELTTKAPELSSWNPASWNLASKWNDATQGLYDAAMYSASFVTDLSKQATDTLGKVFDDKGDAAKVATYQKTTLDASTQAQFAAHKDGAAWTADGVSYYKSADASVVRDKNGVHYYGKDGLEFDGSKGNGTLTKDGETVVKDGDKYFKKYPDGEQVQITDKGDIESIVKVEGMIFEQRKHALAAMGPELLADARERGNRTVTGPDGVQVFKVDANGDVVGKSSKEHGAFVRLAKDGSMYRVKDGQVFTIGADGKETPVADGNLPPQMKRGPNGAIEIGTITLSKDNQYTDSVHNQHMNDQSATVTADTPKGPVVASVVDGKESVKTPDHEYAFDPADKGGKLCVYNNSDHSTDLTFDNFSKTLTTDGATWGPSGISLDNGACCIDNNDNVFNGDGDNVFSTSYAQYQSDSQSESLETSQSAAGAVTLDASDEVADVNSELSAGTIDYGDVGDLNSDYAALTRANGLNLDATSKASVERALAQVESEMPLVESQANASELAMRLTGVQNAELTKEIMDNGGGNIDPIMKRWGLLPMEIVDDKVA